MVRAFVLCSATAFLLCSATAWPVSDFDFQRIDGPKIQESKEGSTQKMIHKLHLKEQEEKEILSTNVLYLCSEWVDEGPARKKM